MNKGELKNGFFLEAGSFNAEFNSDSLYFEINHGWTGLLGLFFFSFFLLFNKGTVSLKRLFY